MEFFDGWRALNSTLDASDLTASTQLVMYKLYYMFDEQRFPESLLVSDRELMNRAGLKSTRTVVEARRQLKNHGLIDFDAKERTGTRYTLGKCFAASKQQVNSKETDCKQAVNSEQIPNINARTPLSAECQVAREDIFEVWNENILRPLGGEQKYELLALTERLGFATVKSAILRTKDTNSRLYPRWEDFKQTLGGDANVRVGNQSRDNRPVVRPAEYGRTARNSVATSSGKGRFDDAAPDCTFLYAGSRHG